MVPQEHQQEAHERFAFGCYTIDSCTTPRFFSFCVLRVNMGTILPSGPVSAIASFGSSEGHSLKLGPPRFAPGTRTFLDTHLRTVLSPALYGNLMLAFSQNRSITHALRSVPIGESTCSKPETIRHIRGAGRQKAHGPPPFAPQIPFPPIAARGGLSASRPGGGTPGTPVGFRIQLLIPTWPCAVPPSCVGRLRPAVARRATPRLPSARAAEHPGTKAVSIRMLLEIL